MTENVFADEDFLDGILGEDDTFTEEESTPSSGRTCSKEGYYHVYVSGVKPESPDHEGHCSVVRLDLKILAGEHEDQVGNILFHRVRLFRIVRDAEKNPIGREAYDKDYLAWAMRAAVGLGLAPREGGRLSRVPWAQAENCQAVVRVDMDTERKNRDTGKMEKLDRPTFEIKFGNFWRPDDEAVADVPKDAESLAYLAAGGGLSSDGLADI